MRIKQYISIGLVLILALGQIALANHSATHVDHGFSHKVATSHSDHSHDHHDEEENQECAECLINHTLQAALIGQSSSLTLEIDHIDFKLSQQIQLSYFLGYRTNIPRAPPAILI